jgi:hypothetical protein
MKVAGVRFSAASLRPLMLQTVFDNNIGMRFRAE